MFEKLQEVSTQAWLAALPSYQASAVSSLLQEHTMEEAAKMLLASVGDTRNSPYGGGSNPNNLYDSVLTEVRKFICGDTSYDDLRAQALEQWERGQLYIVGTVAAAVGSILGIAAAVLVPVISVIFAMVVKLGVNAWCALGPSHS